MTARRRFSRIFLVTLLTMMGLAPGDAASAATARYASPAGSGSDCTQQVPCLLGTALSLSADGDDVYAFADKGDYVLSSLSTGSDRAIHLHGLNGSARLIFTSGGMTLNAGSTAESLYIEVHGNSTAFHISPGASADRVFVTTTATGDHACYMQEAVLTNSVCWAGDTGDLAMETDGSNTMRNDTFFGGTDEALMAFGRHCSCDFTDTLVNVILRSASGGIDINAESDGNGSITVDVTHSNYETTATTGAGAPDKTIIAGDATNQTATPLFVDAAAGDFHEAAGSPTIDAGINDAANGTNDLDGDPRTTNGTTDIGAFEFGAPGPTPPDTRITKSTIKPGKRKATFEFAAIGDATGFECALARSGKPLTFKTCSSPKSYRNLKDGHYKFKVRALSSAGADPTPATKTFKI